jgi:hypothetical protein
MKAHTLYRFWDPDVLLYIGITGNHGYRPRDDSCFWAMRGGPGDLPGLRVVSVRMRRRPASCR